MSDGDDAGTDVADGAGDSPFGGDPADNRDPAATGGPTAPDDGLADKFEEPSEFDPTERFGDPEADAPSAPEVSNPAESLPDPSEVDGAIHRAFWTAVLWTNLALAGVTLGPAYAFLAGDTKIGAAATVVGVFAAVRVYQTIRAFKNGQTESVAAADGGSPSNDE